MARVIKTALYLLLLSVVFTCALSNPVKSMRKSSGLNRQKRTFNFRLFSPRDWTHYHQTWRFPSFSSMAGMSLFEDEEVHDSLRRRISELENGQRRIIAYLRKIMAEKNLPCMDQDINPIKAVKNTTDNSSTEPSSTTPSASTLSTEANDSILTENSNMSKTPSITDRNIEKSESIDSKIDDKKLESSDLHIEKPDVKKPESIASSTNEQNTKKLESNDSLTNEQNTKNLESTSASSTDSKIENPSSSVITNSYSNAEVPNTSTEPATTDFESNSPNNQALPNEGFAAPPAISEQEPAIDTPAINVRVDPTSSELPLPSSSDDGIEMMKVEPESDKLDDNKKFTESPLADVSIEANDVMRL